MSEPHAAAHNEARPSACRLFTREARSRGWGGRREYKTINTVRSFAWARRKGEKLPRCSSKDIDQRGTRLKMALLLAGAAVSLVLSIGGSTCPTGASRLTPVRMASKADMTCGWATSSYATRDAAPPVNKAAWVNEGNGYLQASTYKGAVVATQATPAPAPSPSPPPAAASGRCSVYERLKPRPKLVGSVPVDYNPTDPAMSATEFTCGWATGTCKLSKAPTLASQRMPNRCFVRLLPHKDELESLRRQTRRATQPRQQTSVRG